MSNPSKSKEEGADYRTRVEKIIEGEDPYPSVQQLHDFLKTTPKENSFEKTFEGMYNLAIESAKRILEVFVNNGKFDTEHYGEIIAQLNKLKNKL